MPRRGGSRKGSGAVPKHLQELDNSSSKQQTLFGGIARTNDARKRKAATSVTVAEAREKRIREEEESRKASEAAKARREAAAKENSRKREEAIKALEKMQKELERNILDDSDTEDEEDFSDDEDYDIEDDKEEGGDVGGGCGDDDKRKSIRRAFYKPPSDSELDLFLRKKKEEILDHPDRSTGREWYGPTKSAVPRSDNIKPFDFVECKIHVFHFDPFYDQCTIIEKPLKDHQCIHCKKEGTLESNGWNYRPQHDVEREEVWLLHRRLVCKKKSGGCGRTFAEFHPEFLAQLPTTVVESFPFITTPSGLGVSNSMMYNFLYDCCKGMLFTSYCNKQNEEKKRKYFQRQATYYDLLADRAKKKAELGVDFSPVPFYIYESPGEYNGIPLSRSLLKSLWLRVSSLFLFQSFHFKTSSSLMQIYSCSFRLCHH